MKRSLTPLLACLSLLLHGCKQRPVTTTSDCRVFSGALLVVDSNRLVKIRHNFTTQQDEIIELISGDSARSMRSSPQCLSPDGRFLVINIERSGTADPTRIFEIATKKEITLEGRDLEDVRWSPDSSHFNCGRKGRVYLVSSEGKVKVVFYNQSVGRYVRDGREFGVAASLSDGHWLSEREFILQYRRASLPGALVGGDSTASDTTALVSLDRPIQNFDFRFHVMDRSRDGKWVLVTENQAGFGSMRVFPTEEISSLTKARWDSAAAIRRGIFGFVGNPPLLVGHEGSESGIQTTDLLGKRRFAGQAPQGMPFAGKPFADMMVAYSDTTQMFISATSNKVGDHSTSRHDFLFDYATGQQTQLKLPSLGLNAEIVGWINDRP